MERWRLGVGAKCVGVGDGSRSEEDINFCAVREGCASGLGKKVIGCNGEVRGGASGIGIGDTASCLLHTCIDIISELAYGFIRYSQLPSQLNKLG
jgi:hypothetical protein